VASSRIDLHRRRIGRHDDYGRSSEPFRGDRDPLRMISRRKGNHPGLPLLVRKLKQAVGRTAKLEGMAGLQILALEPQSRAADAAFHQRGSMDQVAEALGGLHHVGTGNDRGFE
jgi:hypothetical protein